jgi:hypothetical protein
MATFHSVYRGCSTFFIDCKKFPLYNHQTLKQFLPILNTKLTYVIALEEHVVAYKKGIIHDIWCKEELEHMIVEGAWIINK